MSVCNWFKKNHISLVNSANFIYFMEKGISYKSEFYNIMVVDFLQYFSAFFWNMGGHPKTTLDMA